MTNPAEPTRARALDDGQGPDSRTTERGEAGGAPQIESATLVETDADALS